MALDGRCYSVICAVRLAAGAAAGVWLFTAASSLETAAAQRVEPGEPPEAHTCPSRAAVKSIADYQCRKAIRPTRSALASTGSQPAMRPRRGSGILTFARLPLDTRPAFRETRQTNATGVSLVGTVLLLN